MTERELKKNLKRERIIESALKLFSRKNYHEVMMEDVAKLTSVAKGTVYNYFTSKEELYFFIMRQNMESLIDSLKNKITQEENNIDSLRVFVTYLYIFMMKYQNFFLMYRKELLPSKFVLSTKTGENLTEPDKAESDEAEPDKAESDEAEPDEAEPDEACYELLALEHKLRGLLAGIINSGKEEGLFRDIENDFAVNIILGSIYGAVQSRIDNNPAVAGQNYFEEEMIKERDRIFEFILYGLHSANGSRDILPLKGKTIVITRTVDQSNESSKIFIRLGADVIIFPTLEIVPPSSWQQFDEILTGKDNINYIIFTSSHAVSMFKKRCEELKLSINYKSGLKVVAVGSKTANVCKEFGIPVHIIPQKFSGEAVVDELSKYDLKNKIVFIPRSALGREALPNGLKELGAIIKPAPVYNVALPAIETLKEPLVKLNKSKPDLFIFTSPSTFENFLQILNITDPAKYFNGSRIAVIGPTTKSAIEERKVTVDIMPDEYTIDGLAKTIVDYYKMNAEKLTINNLQ
jgi:uroporphyrinogen-III synthase/AcrR family transcriptional regulator